MLKKFQSIVLIFFMLVSISICASFSFAAQSETNKETLNPQIIKLMQDQAPAVEAYTYLTNIVDNGFNELIADNYAGAYIEDNRLVVLYTSKNGVEEKAYEDLLEQYPVTIKEVKYSIKELNKIIDEYINNNDNVEGCYIDFEKNRAVIQTTDKEYSRLKLNSLDSDLPIIFKTVEEVKPYVAYDLVGGYQLSKGSSAWTTLGVCGTYSGKPVIVTSGHGWENGDLAYWGDMKIGKVIVNNYSNKSKGDYSLIEVTGANVKTTNLVMSDQDFYEIKGSLSLPVGGLGYRYGARTGLEAVEVTALNVSIKSDGIITKGMTETIQVSGSNGAPGDSGGPLYAMNSNGKWCISGIYVGGGADNPKVGYCTPINKISGFEPKIK